MIEVFHWVADSKLRANLPMFDILSKIMQGDVDTVIDSIAARRELHASGLELIKVAEIDIDDLDDALMLVNSPNRDWAKTKGVRRVAQKLKDDQFIGARKTLVGDVLRRGTATIMVDDDSFVQLPADVDLDAPLETEPQPQGPRVFVLAA